MRLDSYLVENGFYTSRAKASQAIERGEVTVGHKIKKASYEVKDGDDVIVEVQQKFVSMGGYKLEKALDDFKIDVFGLTFADVGASTGGFTDCLLQRGAKKVFAIDVGENQLDKSLVCDKVVILDKLNAREMTEQNLGEKVDGAVIDCSFISLKLLLGSVKELLKENGFIVALIKPQFECGKKSLSKKGIVLDEKTRLLACESVKEYAILCGMEVVGLTNSPTRTGKNCEYLIYLKKCQTFS